MDLDLLSQLDQERLPNHLDIVKDGNQRWAPRRNLPRHAGYCAGACSVDDRVPACRQLGIPALTLYVLSTKNLDRPRVEVAVLMACLTPLATLVG